MKEIKILVGALIVLGALCGFVASSLAEVEFEGVMKLKIENLIQTSLQKEFNMPPVQEADMYVKGKKIRIDGLGSAMFPNMTSIIDFEKQMILLLMTDQKKYSELTFEQMKSMTTAALKMVKGLGSETELETTPPKIIAEKTTEKRKFNDFDCELYVVKDQDVASDFWVSKELPNIYKKVIDVLGSDKFGGKQLSDMMSTLDGMPIKIVNKEAGRVANTLDVVKVEKKTLDAKLFEAPGDFDKLDLPSFGAK